MLIAGLQEDDLAGAAILAGDVRSFPKKTKPQFADKYAGSA